MWSSSSQHCYIQYTSVALLNLELFYCEFIYLISLLYIFLITQISDYYSLSFNTTSDCHLVYINLIKVPHANFNKINKKSKKSSVILVSHTIFLHWLILCCIFWFQIVYRDCLCCFSDYPLTQYEIILPPYHLPSVYVNSILASFYLTWKIGGYK